jgi:type 1 glutamine amidotransferase
MTMRPRSTSLSMAAATALTLLALGSSTTADDSKSAKPLRALLITGGCCHDYGAQKVIISNGISARAPVEWTIVHEGGDSKDHKFSVYSDPDWAKKYDVVVHNECSGAVADREHIKRVVAAHHGGVPAVMIHCTMHTFRALESDEWRECLGVTTRRHGPQQPLEVKNLAPDNPIMKGFPAVWTTGKEELYAIEKVWPGTVPLAQAYALDNKQDHAVIWTHTFGKGRVFGTTLAHNNTTMRDPVYLDMLTRGLLWACDKLEKDGTPKPGYNRTASQP